MFACPKCKCKETFILEARTSGPNRSFDIVVDGDGKIVVFFNHIAGMQCLKCDYESDVCSFYDEEPGIEILLRTYHKLHDGLRQKIKSLETLMKADGMSDRYRKDLDAVNAELDRTRDIEHARLLQLLEDVAKAKRRGDGSREGYAISNYFAVRYPHG